MNALSQRIDSTEYAIVNTADGHIITGAFTDKNDALQDLQEWRDWNPNHKYAIVHRRVIRESYYLTTD